MQREPLEVLRDCFTEQEWQELSHEPAFQAALQHPKTMAEIEPVVSLGQNLLRLANHEKRPA